MVSDEIFKEPSMGERSKYYVITYKTIIILLVTLAMDCRGVENNVMIGRVRRMMLCGGGARGECGLAHQICQT